MGVTHSPSHAISKGKRGRGRARASDQGELGKTDMGMKIKKKERNWKEGGRQATAIYLLLLLLPSSVPTLLKLDRVM